MFKQIPQNFNFIEMEKSLLRRWYDSGLIKKYLQKNKNSKKTFSFQDGPITANNPMGVHHAWGRTYKDLWQKFFNLLGYRQRFQNGFDCQGLWVEVEVEKELKLKTKKDIENLVSKDKKSSIAKFVQLCKDRVLKYAAIQTDQSKRLGYFMDWENSYFTMNDENNYMIWYFLKKCYEHGWIYKGEDSVPWCPRCETAISQHEMLTEDYKETVHESIYLKLKIQNRNEYLLVWTTTPWTLPANIAVAVDESFDYLLVEGMDGNLFWLIKDRVDTVFKGKYKRIVKTVKGKALVGMKYTTPFDDLPAVRKVAEKNPKTFHTVIPTDQKILPISVSDGTGMVHTAVSAGTEDFRLGKKLGLPMIPVIADNADYLPELGFLTGKNAKKNPRIVLDYLLKLGNWVFEIHNYKHSYPACWRCKTELVWKVEEEWYIAMDIRSKIKNQKSKSKEQRLTLRERMVGVAKNIRWIPEFGLERELDWLNNMHDWLISKKNRYWGLALPIFECVRCKEFDVIGSKEELKCRAAAGWIQFEGHSPHKPYIDEVTIYCKKCKSEIRRIDDVGNPWLDAGIVPFSTITENNKGEPLYVRDKNKWKEWFPADFITESFPGQFKNWFYSLIAMTTVLENENSFKTVLGFGTLLGEDSRPMHKSWGNSVDFNEGADKIGVDVMRWMYCRQNPQDNMLFGYKKADEVRRQFYFLLWNVYKFFTENANLDQWNKIKSNLKSENILDKWIVSKFNRLIFDIEKYLRDYNAKDAIKDIEMFINDLSTWYVRRSRERVWVNSSDENDKDFFYSTLHSVLVNLAIVLSPFIPFISEEIYSNLTGCESVHLEVWPISDKNLIDKKLEREMEEARKVCELGHAKRKELNIKVRRPLSSASFVVTVDISRTKDLVASELNVKQVFWKVGKEVSLTKIDTKITDNLKKEGQMRDIIRQIQARRKELGAKLNERVEVYLSDWPSELEEDIKSKTLADKLIKSKEFKVEKKQ